MSADPETPIPHLYDVAPDEPMEWAFELDMIQDVYGITETAYEVQERKARRLTELRADRHTRYLEEIGSNLATVPNANPIYDAIEKRVERLDLAALMLEDDEPIDWIWGDGDQGYIERASVGCFHAFGGVGKSMVMQALTRSVTSGDELLGLPCSRGRVLIIDAENPRREIKRRVKRLGLDPERTRYLRTVAPIFELGFSDWLYEEITFHQADLLVLDSQRGLWGGDEKEANEVRLFYTELRNVADETNCAIVVIHHDNKGLTFSGSTDIDAAVDFRLHMTRDTKDEKLRFLKQAKMRGAEELPTIEVVIRFEGMRLYVERGDRTANGIAPPPATRKATAEEIAMFVRQQANQTSTPATIRQNFGISDTTLRSRRDELVTLGIHYWEGGKNSVYHVTPNPNV